MFFLNLSLPELLAVLGTASGIVVALYLLDRARRRQTVATLRFFSTSAHPPERAHRRHLQQPWSLLLQLLGMAFLLLALAQPRLGSPEHGGRNHVLILDTSAWMNARNGSDRLIDRARASALAWLDRMPPADRVMLVRADALATPATSFTDNRETVRRAIGASQPGASTLNVEQAVSFAEEAQRVRPGSASAGLPGEIVFAGAGRIGVDTDSGFNPPRNLRWISVESPAAPNYGLRKITVRRANAAPGSWDIFISAKNYSPTAHTVSLTVWFDGAVIGTRPITLRPGAETNASFEYKTDSAGRLDVRLSPDDVFPQDNRAVLELPSQPPLTIVVYSDDAGSLRPVFNGIPGVAATFLPTSRYTTAGSARARIVVLDRFAPPEPPLAATIWIEPPAGRSPIPVGTEADNVRLTRWRADHPLGAGLHARDLEIAHSLILRPAAGDIRVAESAAGPLIVARPGRPQTVVLGFQPMRSAMEYQLAAPLLFANIIRWIAPDVFRRLELWAGPPGTVEVALDSEQDPAAVHVWDENGRGLPFTLDGPNLRFFTATPGVVRVQTGDREFIESLTLPDPGEAVWKPENVARGQPPRRSPATRARDYWQLLALVGGALLLADWLLFGTAARRNSRTAMDASATRKDMWRKAS